MKTSFDPRHIKRQKAVEDLFRNDFHKQTIGIYPREILKHNKKIDSIIQKAAPEFPINKINKTDLSILRLAVYELVVEKKEPPRVIIDEAIELAKEYGGDTSPAFVNGALGEIVKNDKNT
jgi:N utilization substance protein B